MLPVESLRVWMILSVFMCGHLARAIRPRCARLHSVVCAQDVLVVSARATFVRRNVGVSVVPPRRLLV